ncbi:MAG: hypothetical protein ABUL72_02885 [Armatimonadota bacterium]
MKQLTCLALSLLVGAFVLVGCTPDAPSGQDLDKINKAQKASESPETRAMHD